MKIKNFEVTMEFIRDFGGENEAFASVALNPNFRWARIRVCDDEPNANKQRIPVDEYVNLINTGILTPIKMAEGKIAGHAEAKGRPVGVIHSMKQEDNILDALVALWAKERPSDIEALEKMYNDGNPPNVSWEVGYTDSEISDGIETLRGVQFNGLAIVKNPAYRGRTKVLAMAEEDEVNIDLEESNSMDELEKLQAELDSTKASLSEKEAEIVKLNEQLVASETEKQTLAEFKTNVEKEAGEIKKLDGIRERFSTAGIEKDEKYFAENKETLLSLAESTLDFMLQEMVSLKPASAEDTSKTKKLPNLNDGKLNSEDLTDPKNLGKALRNLNKKEVK